MERIFLGALGVVHFTVILLVIGPKKFCLAGAALLNALSSVVLPTLLIQLFGIRFYHRIMQNTHVTFRTFEGFRIFKILRHFFPTRRAVHSHIPIHDIILHMADETEEQEGSEPPKEGQLLGCLFALGAVGFVFFLLFFFLRACA